MRCRELAEHEHIQSVPQLSWRATLLIQTFCDAWTLSLLCSNPSSCIPISLPYLTFSTQLLDLLLFLCCSVFEVMFLYLWPFSPRLFPVSRLSQQDSVHSPLSSLLNSLVSSGEWKQVSFPELCVLMDWCHSTELRCNPFCLCLFSQI